jgi:phosphatidylserine/phosphatidylglycerophosphate/cardiolipin synthase-like enzyme
MNKFILALSVLSVSALANAKINFELADNNPLKPFAIDANGIETRKFEIDYSTLVQYYNYSGQGILTEQSNLKSILDKSYKLKGIQKDELRFKVNLDKMTITPTAKIAPESMQALFKFDIDRFIEASGEKDFVTAKYEYFKNLKFDEETQLYERNYLHLSDWKSLIHPPVTDVSDTDKFFQDSKDIPLDSEMLTDSFNQEMDQLTKTELTTGNKLKLLVNNISFKEKLKQIKAAKKSILVGVMSFASDPTAVEVIDALIEKSKEGVDVQIMLEKLWTVLFFRNTMDRITAGGIKLILANDMYHQLNPEKKGLFHNKIWVFDEKLAIVGGQNVVNSANSSTGFNHWNKDTDVLIEGPMVTDVLAEYVVLKRRYDTPKNKRKTERLNLDQGKTAEYYEAIVNAKKAEERRMKLRGAENYTEWFSTLENASAGVCRFIIQGPQKDKHALSKAYTRYFQAAKDHIYFTSQHIEYDMSLPTENKSWETEIFKALFKAGEKGVRVDLLANGIDGGFAEIGQNIALGTKKEKREKKLARKFARQTRRGKDPGTFMSKLSVKLGLKSAIKFGVYLKDAVKKPNFNAWMHFQYIHSKTALVDNIMASIGSFNFEPYSAEKSHESAVFCFDQGLAQDLKMDNIRDIVNSTPVLKPGETKLSLN